MDYIWLTHLIINVMFISTGDLNCHFANQRFEFISILWHRHREILWFYIVLLNFESVSGFPTMRWEKDNQHSMNDFSKIFNPPSAHLELHNLLKEAEKISFVFPNRCVVCRIARVLFCSVLLRSPFFRRCTFPSFQEYIYTYSTIGIVRLGLLLLLLDISLS